MEPFALWTADEAARATQGRIQGGWTASGVSIDSRSIAFGDLFFALRGPSFDGHAFVRQALEKGASAAVVDHLPADVSNGANLLVVADTFQALNDMAAAARQRSAARVIGVTGSVGKTGTKEMLTQILAAQGPTHASLGNLNNHWGVPLTLCRMPPDAQFAVIEMGMNHANEIAPLSRLARPHVAIITTVEAVHLENFDSIEGIAAAKAEIFVGLEAAGTEAPVAILNRDNPHFDFLASEAGVRGARVIGFGEHAAADARLIKYVGHPECSCVSAEILGQPINYKIGNPGRHWVQNSLGVLAAIQVVGGDLAQAGFVLGQMKAPKGRGARIVRPWNGGNLEIIDDSYNASPPSMRAAFAVLAQSKTAAARGRRIAVLGDMLELGPDEQRLHAELAADILTAGIDLVFTAGARMQALHDALPPEKRGAHAARSSELTDTLRGGLRAGDIVLVKGSHGSRMDLVVEALLATAPVKRAAGGW